MSDEMNELYSTGECLKTLNGHTNTVVSIAIASNGDIISGSNDKTIKIWSSSTGECLKTLNGHTDSVRSVAIASNGDIISGSDDKTIKIWSSSTGECLKTLNGHTNTVKSVVIASNGDIVSGSYDKTTKIWSSSTGECLKTLNGHTSFVASVAIASNGDIISGSFDNTIKIWSSSTGECLKTLNGHTDSVRSVAIASNGDIISGSDDKTTKIWSSSTGECLKTLNGHTKAVVSIAIASNGDIISGSADKTIKIWSSSTGECLKTITGHTDAVFSVAIASNGDIISGSDDKTIKIWLRHEKIKVEEEEKNEQPTLLSSIELNELQSKLDEAINRIQALENNKSTLTSQVNNLNNELTSLRDQLNNIVINNNNNKLDVAVLAKADVRFQQQAASVAKMQQELKATTDKLYTLRESVKLKELDDKKVKEETEKLVRETRESMKIERENILKKLKEDQMASAAGNNELKKRIDAIAELQESKDNKEELKIQIEFVAKELLKDSSKNTKNQIDNLRGELMIQRFKNSELEEKLNDTRTDIESMVNVVEEIAIDSEENRMNIESMLKEHDDMFAEFEAQRLEVDAQALLQEDPILSVFYTTIRSRLVSVFSGLQVLQSGMIENESAIKQTWSFLRDRVADMVPGANLVLSLTDAITGMAKRLAQNNSSEISSKLIDVNWSTMSMNQTAERTARRLTNIYEPALHSLTGNSSTQRALKQLANGAIARIVCYLGSRHNDSDDKFWSSISTQDALITAMCTCVAVDNEKLVRVPGNKKLSNKHGQIWTENGLFARSGVIVSTINNKGVNKFHFYINSKKGSFKDKYGFRMGTKSEVDMMNLQQADKYLDMIPITFKSMLNSIIINNNDDDDDNVSITSSNSRSSLSNQKTKKKRPNTAASTSSSSSSSSNSKILRRVDCVNMNSNELRKWLESTLNVRVLDSQKWKKKSINGRMLFDKLRDGESKCDSLLKNAGITMSSSRKKVLRALKL